MRELCAKVIKVWSEVTHITSSSSSFTKQAHGHTCFQVGVGEQLYHVPGRAESEYLQKAQLIN